MANRGADSGLIVDPTWYKDAIIYELYIRSFCDSNEDGIGDLPGLIQKIDYLADLGVTALWLLPFYPSPLRDGGYDIADYYNLDPSCGTMRDWKTFLRAAHSRGLRVITEFVLNHTSDQHEWFQRSRRAKPGSRWRDFYVWTDKPDKYKDARIIFKDFEASNWTWDPVAGAYFWHRFYSHQPDLNFDSPEVHKAIFRVIDFWLDQGVDGFRLDAIPYLYERENTSCENLPETHQFLKDLRHHVDTKYGGRMLLAEANAWPEVAAAYFGQGEGDECHMAFHFPLMPRLFMGVRMEDKTPIVDILQQMPNLPSTSQWALFLRNHDELTLEMVTDEERDYMYGVYAQDAKARLNLGIRRRLAPLLGNDRRKIELMNMLLLSMPGTPVIYYGDEIGMGDNIYLADRDGVRTPMHWNSDKNAGFSKANPQALPFPVVVDPEYHYEALNVEAQQRNPNSLLWWTKRLISLRKKWKAFGRGSFEFIGTNNNKVLAFVRRYDNECILVVANLSRLPQPLELKTAGMEEQNVTELFGHTEFPPIASAHYPMTLSPHSAFWFSLTPRKLPKEVPTKELGRPVLSVQESWREGLIIGSEAPVLSPALAQFLPRQPWFLSLEKIEKCVVREVLELDSATDLVCAVLQVDYFNGDPEFYLVPLAFNLSEGTPFTVANELVIAEVKLADGREGILYDGVGHPKLLQSLAGAILGRKVPRSDTGVCRAWRLSFPSQPVLAALRNQTAALINRSNSTLELEDQFYLKIFRRLQAGKNPEVEAGRLLTEKHFAHVPEIMGTLDYRENSGKNYNLAIMHRAVDANDAWKYMVEVLGRYYDRVRTIPEAASSVLRLPHTLIASTQEEIPVPVTEIVGTSLEFARLLGRRTAEMHAALVDNEKTEFSPEPFTPFYLRSLYQSMRNRIVTALDLVQTRMAELGPEHQADATRLIEKKEALFSLVKVLAHGKLKGVRIRCHGNYQLTELLYTGKDFYMVDFEGNPSRSIGERQIKRPPALDLAKMLRSFQRVAQCALNECSESGIFSSEHALHLKPWASFWSHWVGVSFLQSYFRTAGENSVLVNPRTDFEQVLKCLIVDKTTVELLFEIRRTPQAAWFPIQGLLSELE